MSRKESITTIKVSRETKERLEHIRVYKRESYDEIMQKMLEILNICKINPPRARARLIAIDRQKRLSDRPQRQVKSQRPIKPLARMPLRSLNQPMIRSSINQGV